LTSPEYDGSVKKGDERVERRVAMVKHGRGKGE